MQNEIIESAKEALAFAKGEPNECVVNDTRVYWSHWQVGDKIIMHYGIYTIDSIKGAIFTASNPDYGTEKGIVGNYKNLRTDFGADAINHHSD